MIRRTQAVSEKGAPGKKPVLQATPAENLSDRSPSATRFLRLQQTMGNLAVRRLLEAEPAHRPPRGRVQRDEPEQAETLTEPTAEVYREYVEAAIRLFEGAADRYGIAPVSAGPIVLGELLREEWATRSAMPCVLSGFSRFLESLIAALNRAGGPEGILREIARILPEWQRVYDAARGFITAHLAQDAALADQLRAAYLAGLESLHRSARDRTPRVSVNLIAEPPAPGDDFITNATAYARSYFTRPQQQGDVIETVEGIDTPAAMLDAVERTMPERLIRRINVFAHGTIDPSNQIRFGPNWHTVADIEAEAEAQNRAYESDYLQSTARFDDRSTMELHACRLGGGTGQQFLDAFGGAVGGRHGQQMIAYTQRWYPHRFELFWTWNAPGGGQGYNERVVSTTDDIYGANALPDRCGHPVDHNGFIARFEGYAVQVFDDVVAASQEVRSFLNDTELAGGAVTRDRKIEIMRAMYDQNGAWLLGFLHPDANANPSEARAAEASADYAFTGEADWQARLLTVTVQPPAAPVP